MLVLKCEGIQGQTYQSRVGVLETGGGEQDYALGAAHGIFGFDSCRVEDNTGAQRPVSAHRLAPDYDPAEPTSVFVDWAVLSFKRFDNPTLVRFAVDDRPEEPASITAALIPQGRGLLVNTQLCSITFRDARVPPIGAVIVYPTHSCRMRSGQSGTPMTVSSEDGQHQLYGMLTGRTLLYRDWEGKGPRWYGRFIPVDNALAGKIKSTVKALEEELG